MAPTIRAVYADADPSDEVVAVLRDAGIEPDVVGTAADCLAALSSADCVVIGGPLPDGSPATLCTRIRAQCGDVPIVVAPTAADGSEELAGNVIAAGADGYVPRSQGVAMLATRLHDLLQAQSRSSSADDDIETASEPPSPDAAAERREPTPTDADRNRIAALEALQETTHELLRAESAAEIAAIVTAATEHVVDDPLAALYLRTDDDGHIATGDRTASERLEPVGTTPRLEAVADDVRRVGPGDGLLWRAYTAAEPTVVADITPDHTPHPIADATGTVALQPLGEHGLLAVGSGPETDLDAVAVHLLGVLAATAEAALDRAVRERELERTEAIVETVGDGVYSLDSAGRFVTVNDAMTEVTGYERVDLVGAHISTILTDESAERRRKRIRALSSAGRVDNHERDGEAIAAYEVTLETRDGRRVPCEINAALTGPDGDLEGTVGIVRDISDRKRMQHELVAHEAKIANLHEVASRLDDCETREEIYALTLEAAEEVLHFDACVVDVAEGESLVKKAISSEIDEEYARTMSIDEGIAGKTYQTGQTYRIADVAASEDAAPESDEFRSALSVPIGETGVFQAVSTDPDAFDAEDAELAELLLSHVADALDRFDFEAEIRAERDRFAALFENVPDAAVIAHHTESGEPIVEAVNPAFEHLFGYEADNLVGEPLDERIVPPDRSAAAMAINRRSNRGSVVETEGKRRTADGLRDFMIRVVPVTTDASAGGDDEGDNDEASVERTVGLYTDITDRKRQQQQLEILNRVLRHDLRNGMNIIDGCAEELADRLADDGTEAAEYATIIRERADDLLGLAEKTRAVERTLERDEAIHKPVDLVSVLQQVTDRLECTYASNEGKPAALTVELADSVPEQCFVRGTDYLETAIFQVLENAVEHNDSAAPTIEIRLSDASAGDGSGGENGGPDEMVTLSIADDGPGIPDEERALLQEDREITQLRHASGLGLWLVNWVVSQSGGQLAFRANQPRGTVVDIRLPRVDSESARVGTDESASGD
ncbi:PAS domain S-box protein [Halopiger xanaduensis]|uniref:Multi-sensor signal transduction histidine kinase n=1 Tax=Halopiger xanaduensis (strain DSM 18323 / JCM 14033 / SH-6) TaxID=797210 RepID=F8D4K9_HALXS|nr:PAS domain S-box protein [Halopiger xanaduensis]AEH36337.1 multi-sensor signal transduction histidine kinase [Halopiger xanaduensis SH-6]